MTKICFVYVTARDADEAREIGRKLLMRRLIACANILPQMESIYRWEGEIRQDNEAVMILKTEARLVDEVIAAIEELHSYDTPCALSFAIEEGSENYLAWVSGELKAN